MSKVWSEDWDDGNYDGGGWAGARADCGSEFDANVDADERRGFIDRKWDGTSGGGFDGGVDDFGGL